MGSFSVVGLWVCLVAHEPGASDWGDRRECASPEITEPEGIVGCGYRDHLPRRNVRVRMAVCAHRRVAVMYRWRAETIQSTEVFATDTADQSSSSDPMARWRAWRF